MYCVILKRKHRRTSTLRTEPVDRVSSGSVLPHGPTLQAHTTHRTPAHGARAARNQAAKRRSRPPRHHGPHPSASPPCSACPGPLAVAPSLACCCCSLQRSAGATGLPLRLPTFSPRPVSKFKPPSPLPPPSILHPLLSLRHGREGETEAEETSRRPRGVSKFGGGIH